MKTFWVRVYCDPDTIFKYVDAWKTGYGPQGHAIFCFAVRGDDEGDVHDLLAEMLCGGSYETDTIDEKPWKTFGDFAGSTTRFRLAEKYLGDKIDTIETVRDRMKPKSAGRWNG